MKYEEPTTEQYAKFGRAVAALMGTQLEWGSDITAAIGELAVSPINPEASMLGVQLGDQDKELLAFWRQVADAVGIDYEVGADEDDTRECDNCGETVGVLSSRDLCDGCEAGE